MSVESVIIAILIILGIIIAVIILMLIRNHMIENEEDDWDEDDLDEDDLDEDDPNKEEMDKEALRELLEKYEIQNRKLCAEKASYKLERRLYLEKFLEVLKWYGIARALHPEIIGEIQDTCCEKTIPEQMELYGKIDPCPEIAPILKKLSKEPEWQSLREDFDPENNLPINEFLEKSMIEYNKMIADEMSTLIIDSLANSFAIPTSKEAKGILAEAVLLMIERQNEDVLGFLKENLSKKSLYDSTGQFVPMCFNFEEDAEN